MKEQISIRGHRISEVRHCLATVVMQASVLLDAQMLGSPVPQVILNLLRNVWIVPFRKKQVTKPRIIHRGV